MGTKFSFLVNETFPRTKNWGLRGFGWPRNSTYLDIPIPYFLLICNLMLSRILCVSLKRLQQNFCSLSLVPRELRAPEDFLKRRYNLLDMSTMRVAYYGLDSWLSAFSGQHAWHSCRAGCIVISENPQGLATHMVRILKTLVSRNVRLAKHYVVWLSKRISRYEHHVNVT